MESDHHQQQLLGQGRPGLDSLTLILIVNFLTFLHQKLWPVVSRGPEDLTFAIFFQFIKIVTNGQRLKFPMNLKLVG